MSVLKTEPVPAEIDGQPLKFLMCQGEAFHKRRSHIDVALSSVMSPDWADRETYCLVCDRCGFIHWFMSK
jgi:hypothetical protein